MQSRFKQLLDEKNLTAKHFADLIKVNASAVSHILNGRSKPGFDVLDKIAQAFPDINLNWLVTGKGKPYIDKQINILTSETNPHSPTLFDEIEISQQKANFKEESVPKFSSDDMPEKWKVQPGKSIKRVIIFYEDGTFESYE